MKQGKPARETQVEVLKAAEIRHRMGLSQGEFAKRWT
jgi:putative transcriptional regulator|tara:strand:+ start:707 stop:817 length:111 start_codon:yes stop_codon:yes gene_type:complete